jgi:hypothetical protein
VEDYLARSTQGNYQNLNFDNTVATEMSVWVEPIPNPNCLGIPIPISVKMAQTETSPNTSTEILAEINIETNNFHSLVQRFSTWGTRTPRGTQAGYRGYAKFKISLK